MLNNVFGKTIEIVRLLKRIPDCVHLLITSSALTTRQLPLQLNTLCALHTLVGLRLRERERGFNLTSFLLSKYLYSRQVVYLWSEESPVVSAIELPPQRFPAFTTVDQGCRIEAQRIRSGSFSGSGTAGWIQRVLRIQRVLWIQRIPGDVPRWTPRLPINELSTLLPQISERSGTPF